MCRQNCLRKWILLPMSIFLYLTSYQIIIHDLSLHSKCSILIPSTTILSICWVIITFDLLLQNFTMKYPIIMTLILPLCKIYMLLQIVLVAYFTTSHERNYHFGSISFHILSYIALCIDGIIMSL